MTIHRRGFQRRAAAEYIGIGTTKFDEMVADKRMPQPKLIDRRKVWDVMKLDEYFDDLPSIEIRNDWNESDD